MGGGAFTQSFGATPTRRADNLAMQFQETLTVVMRLRSNRQVLGDTHSFRSQMQSALQSAADDATRLGYPAEDVRVATFAIVAFLDESVLNSHNPAFSDWVRQPLQQELFGVDMAGEIFFRNADHLLARLDSQELADVLEIYQLAILLGFRGRYSVGSNAELRHVAANIGERIQRIRGSVLPLSFWSALPVEATRPPADPWNARLLWTAAGCWALALILFVIFSFSLNSGASQLRAIISSAHL
jgi:type VI secretion system protein ImpK